MFLFPRPVWFWGRFGVLQWVPDNFQNIFWQGAAVCRHIRLNRVVVEEDYSASTRKLSGTAETDQSESEKSAIARTRERTQADRQMEAIWLSPFLWHIWHGLFVSCLLVSCLLVCSFLVCSFFVSLFLVCLFPRFLLARFICSTIAVPAETRLLQAKRSIGS